MYHIQIEGGRFLKRTKNERVWVVVDDALEVRDKIASSFRSEKKRDQRRKKEEKKDDK